MTANGSVEAIMADPFRRAARFVEKAGLAFLFGGAKAGDLPNLHFEITGRDTIEEWNDDTDLVWQARVELPRLGLAWFGEWLKSRGTFIAVRLLPAALGWLGRSADVDEDVKQAWEISEDAGIIYEAILSEGPIASVALRRAVSLEHADAAPIFQRSLKALQRGLFITNFGHLQETGAWASSVYEPTVRAFPIHEEMPDRGSALKTLVAAYRTASPSPDMRKAARLFGAGLDEVRRSWS
jgi:hypothetical protein